MTGSTAIPDNSIGGIYNGFRNWQLCTFDQNDKPLSYERIDIYTGGIGSVMRNRTLDNGQTETITNVSAQINGSNNLSFANFTKNGLYLTAGFGNLNDGYYFSKIVGNNWIDNTSDITPYDLSISQQEQRSYLTTSIATATGSLQNGNKYDWLVSINRNFDPPLFGTGFVRPGKLRLEKIKYSGNNEDNSTTTLEFVTELALPSVFTNRTEVTTYPSYTYFTPLLCRIMENVQNPNEPLVLVTNTETKVTDSYKVQGNSLVPSNQNIYQNFPNNLKNNILANHFANNALYAHVYVPSAAVDEIYKFNGNAWTKINLNYTFSVGYSSAFFRADKTGLLAGIFTNDPAGKTVDFVLIK